MQTIMENEQVQLYLHQVSQTLIEKIAKETRSSYNDKRDQFNKKIVTVVNKCEPTLEYPNIQSKYY